MSSKNDFRQFLDTIGPEDLEDVSLEKARSLWDDMRSVTSYDLGVGIPKDEESAETFMAVIKAEWDKYQTHEESEDEEESDIDPDDYIPGLFGGEDVDVIPVDEDKCDPTPGAFVGCKVGYACDIKKNMCYKKVAGMLVEVEDGIEFTGTKDDLDAWKKGLEVYKQSLIVRKDGDKKVIVPPCATVRDDGTIIGCKDNEWCNVELGVCAADKGDLLEGRIGNQRVIGSRAALEALAARIREKNQNANFEILGKPEEKEKAPPVPAAVINIGGMSSAKYSEAELDALTVAKLKDLAKDQGVKIGYKDKKADIVNKLLAAGVRKAGSGGPKVEIKENKPQPNIVIDMGGVNVGGAGGSGRKGGVYSKAELEALTVVKLKDLAKDQGVKIGSKDKKADIVDKLLAAGVRKPGSGGGSGGGKVPPYVAPPVILPPPVIIEQKGGGSLYTRDELSALTVVKLKDLAKDRGVKVSGRKDDIIDKLLDANVRKAGGSGGGQVPPVVILPPKPVEVEVVEDEVVLDGDVYTVDELDRMTKVQLLKLAEDNGVKVKKSDVKLKIGMALILARVKKGGRKKPPSPVKPVVKPPSPVKPVIVLDEEEEEKKGVEDVVVVDMGGMKPVKPPSAKPEKPLIEVVNVAGGDKNKKENALLRARLEKCAGLIA